MSLTEEELQALKREFEAIDPLRFRQMNDPNSPYFVQALLIWESFIKGYKLGKTTKGNLT